MNNLLVYTGALEQSDYAARKYRGPVATGYDAERETSPKWHAENAIVTDMLSDLPKGTEVLDCPVGTGRFIPLYESLGFKAMCLDVSDDMLAEAAKKATSDHISFGTRDVRNLEMPDDSVDCSLMIRLTRWLSPADRSIALKELQRVTRKRIIFTARVRDHAHAYPYSEIYAALDGWEITRDDAANEEQYRVIQLEQI